MTDQPGRDTAGDNQPSGGTVTGGPQERPLPVPRPTTEVAPAERFTAAPSIHNTSLSPERAAGIVRQSASARWIGFLATLVVVLFVIAYYFYDLGIPGVANSSRLTAETNAQAVTSVEKGYQIFEANCARCHGAQGQGGIGPVLNDQMKLFVHLNEQYIRNVLFSGGRYVCGNPKSLMPVWDQQNGGPLNYEQINDLIAFIRAPSNETYTVRDPSTQEPVTDASGKVETFTGWRDPNYKPAPNATPFPDCWSDAFKTTAAPSAGASSSSGASGSPGASSSGGPAPSGSGSAGGTSVTITAQNIAFTTTDVTAPANQAFTINFDNEDSGTPHNVDIMDASGRSVFKGDIVNGVTTATYNVPALAAGSYKFQCDVHPNMTGTLTVK
jgi:mono/diheme cytochrome c family protein/plastocyanin